MELLVRRTDGPDDDEQSLAIYNEVWPRHAVTMGEVESFKRSALAYGDHLAFLDSNPVGSGFVAILPARPEVGFAEITVLNAYRRHGAGTALYRDVSSWCAAQGLDTIEGRIEEDDDASLEYVRRRGFTEIERYGGMTLELAGLDVPSADLPAGVEIVTWAERPELARGIYDVAVEAYPDMPGGEADEMESYEDWLAHDMQGSGDLPEATFVALAGTEVIGFAKFSLTAAQPTVAFHDTTGVKRTWRGRGVAGALKRAQIEWAKHRGYERLMTANEVRNEPIRRLNARLGYLEVPGRILMRGPLFHD